MIKKGQLLPYEVIRFFVTRTSLDKSVNYIISTKKKLQSPLHKDIYIKFYNKITLGHVSKKMY